MNRSTFSSRGYSEFFSHLNTLGYISSIHSWMNSGKKTSAHPVQAQQGIVMGALQHQNCVFARNSLYRGRAAPRGAPCQRGAAPGAREEAGRSAALRPWEQPRRLTALLGRPRSRRLDGDLRHPQGWGAAPPGRGQAEPGTAEPGTAEPGAARPGRGPQRLAGFGSAAAAPPLTRGQGEAAPRRRLLPVPEEEEPRSQRDKVYSGKFAAVGRERRRAKGKVAPAPLAAARAPRGGGRSGGSARGGRSASFALRQATAPRRHSEACGGDRRAVAGHGRLPGPPCWEKKPGLGTAARRSSRGAAGGSRGPRRAPDEKEAPPPPPPPGLSRPPP